MDQLEHDPKTKLQIKEALYEFLYAPVTKQFKARIETLIARNTIIGGYSHKHFIYRGIIYNAEVTPPPLKKNRLVSQLKDPMEEYLVNQDLVNNKELPFVLGYINQVLNSSNSLSDYLKLLPESIHAPIQTLLATCPCRVGILSPEKVEQIKERNQQPIQLIKQRLVTNLLF